MGATKKAIKGRAAAFAAASSHATALAIADMLAEIERFDPEDIALCTGALLDKLRAIPLGDTIHIEGGVMYIRGKPVKDPAVHKRIVQAAGAMQHNIARKLVAEKIEYAAAVMARNATSLYDLVFAKAALWVVQQETQVFADISGQPEDSDSDDDTE